MKVAERIHQFPTPTPFYVGSVNAYLIEDDPLTLVDSGLKMEEAEKVLRSDLSEAGYSFGDIGQIVATHAHLDHYGLMATIASEGNARVFAHRLEKRDLESELGYSSPGDRRYKQMEGFLLKSGMPESSLKYILVRHPVFEQLREPVTVTDTLEDGDRLKLKHRELEVIHCPGHSAGMINLYDPEAKVLFSGDNLLKHISPVPILYFPEDPAEPRQHSLAAYLTTLERLKKLDIDIVFTGHGEIIEDVKAIIESIKLHHEVRKRKVLKFIGKAPRTAWEISNHLFPDMDPYHIFLAMSESIGHLDILETDGEARTEEKDGFNYHIATGGA